MADHSRIAALCESLERRVGGEQTIHRDLERELAEFIGVEDTLALVSGYGSNVSLVGHIPTRGDLIVIDEAPHNSIMTGAQASRATIMTFRHADLSHLAEVLSTHRSASSRALVIIEGLYSMDGDIPDLPRCIEICRNHQAWLVVDEAHSIVVFGEGGGASRSTMACRRPRSISSWEHCRKR